MAQFVNYKKRAFTLPPGCNDLIDVLAPSRRHKEANTASYSCQFPGVKVDRFPTAGLAQVARYVTMLQESRAEILAVYMVPYGCDYPVTLFRGPSEPAGIAVVTKDAHQEQAIRALFERHNIDLLQDFPTSDSGGNDAARGLVYKLPSEIPRATSLITDLLRHVYGLNDETGIDFTYYESATNA